MNIHQACKILLKNSQLLWKKIRKPKGIKFLTHTVYTLPCNITATKLWQHSVIWRNCLLSIFVHIVIMNVQCPPLALTVSTTSWSRHSCRCCSTSRWPLPVSRPVSRERWYVHCLRRRDWTLLSCRTSELCLTCLFVPSYWNAWFWLDCRPS